MKIIARKEELSDPIIELIARLRVNLTVDEIKCQIFRQYETGYKVLSVEEPGTVVCIAGFRGCEKLSWGKALYIDDLVTEESARSSGYGSRAIDFLKEHAVSIGCSQLHLDSNIQRSSAHKFYLNKDFKIASFHFSITNLNLS